MKKRLLLLAILLLFIGRMYYDATGDFRPHNITGELPYSPEWDLPLLKHQELQTIHTLLSQTYTYLGKGAQCYAFIGEDGETILKFFKFKHLRPSPLNALLPASLREQKREHLLYKQRSLLSGYTQAYTKNRKHSGLLYVHFYPHQDPLPPLHLVDKIGQIHTLDPKNIPFILQKRGTTLRETLKRALDADNVSLAKRRIEQVLAMYKHEYANGLYDRDHGVLHNTGFIGETPFHLDVGKLTYDPSFKHRNVQEEDLKKVIDRMRPWLTKHYPQYTPHLLPP